MYQSWTKKVHQVAIEVLDSPITTSKLIWECQQKLNQVGKNNKLSILWVPSHMVFEANDVTHGLARKAAASLS